MTKKGDKSGDVTLNTVITADLVRSTESGLSQRQLTKELAEVFSDLQNFLDPGAILLPFTVSRGDSFQGVLAGTDTSLLTAIYIRCAIRHRLELDVRQALGVGGTEEIVGNSTLTSFGEAFLRSGRLIDRMTTPRSSEARIAVDSGNADFDDQFNSLFFLFDTIARRWTTRECEAIFLKLHNWNQTEIASYLGINQSAVHKRLKSADWPAVNVMLKRWEDVAGKCFGESEKGA